jgi:hypothetical protein
MEGVGIETRGSDKQVNELFLTDVTQIVFADFTQREYFKEKTTPILCHTPSLDIRIAVLSSAVRRICTIRTS